MCMHLVAEFPIYEAQIDRIRNRLIHKLIS